MPNIPNHRTSGKLRLPASGDLQSWCLVSGDELTIRNDRNGHAVADPGLKYNRSAIRSRAEICGTAEVSQCRTLESAIKIAQKQTMEPPKAEIMRLIAFVLSSFVLIALAHAASFDRAKAGTTVEHLICDNPDLSKLDDEMAAKYKASLNDSNTKRKLALRRAQKLWLTVRNTCVSADCVKSAYIKRQSALADAQRNQIADKWPAPLFPPANFTGTWTLDIRSAAERSQGIECGVATFTLEQTGNEIVGDHTFSTPGCGRLNEGGAGTVRGTVVGNTATLTVTSGRNGAVVRGRATFQGRSIRWVTLDTLKPGDPEDDSPLILDKGTLKLAQRH